MLDVVKFGLKLVTRSPGTPERLFGRIFGVGISALDHEARDNPMKSRSIKITLRDELLKSLNMLWSLIWEETNDDLTVIRLENGNLLCLVGHWYEVSTPVSYAA